MLAGRKMVLTAGFALHWRRSQRRVSSVGLASEEIGASIRSRTGQEFFTKEIRRLLRGGKTLVGRY
jgi:hypothetical protein